MDLRIFLANFSAILHEIFNKHRLLYLQGYQDPLKGYFNYLYLNRSTVDSISRYAPSGNYSTIQDCLKSELLIYTVSERESTSIYLQTLCGILDARHSTGKPIWIVRPIKWENCYEYNHSKDFRDFINTKNFTKVQTEIKVPSGNIYFSENNNQNSGLSRSGKTKMDVNIDSFLK
jgi:hypothetical protein